MTKYGDKSDEQAAQILLKLWQQCCHSSSGKPWDEADYAAQVCLRASLHLTESRTVVTGRLRSSVDDLGRS